MKLYHHHHPPTVVSVALSLLVCALLFSPWLLSSTEATTATTAVTAAAAAAVAAATTTTTAVASSISVDTIHALVQGSDNDQELFSVLENPTGYSCSEPGKRRGKAHLSPSLVSTLQQKMNIVFSPLTAASSMDEGRTVSTTLLTATSVRHVDRPPSKNNDDCHDPQHHHHHHHQVVDDHQAAISTRVAFVVLNTNPHAYFDYGEDGMSIPIVEGNLVHFDGTIPHHTVIHSGSVQLLGPFDTLGFQPVGVPCGPAGQTGGQCSSCIMTIPAHLQECYDVMTCRICVPLPLPTNRLLGSSNELEQQQQQQDEDMVADVGRPRRTTTTSTTTRLGGRTRGLQNGNGKGQMAPKVVATKTGKGGTTSKTGVVVAETSSGKGTGKGDGCATSKTGGKGGKGDNVGKGGKGDNGVGKGGKGDNGVGKGGKGDGVTTTTTTTTTTSTSKGKGKGGGKGDTSSGSSACVDDDSEAPSLAPSSAGVVACPAPVVFRPVLCLSLVDVAPENYICTTLPPEPV
jgi:hypothetical protein